jgi:hypothetical protein
MCTRVCVDQVYRVSCIVYTAQEPVVLPQAVGQRVLNREEIAIRPIATSMAIHGLQQDAMDRKLISCRIRPTRTQRCNMVPNPDASTASTAHHFQSIHASISSKKALQTSVVTNQVAQSHHGRFLQKFISLHATSSRLEVGAWRRRPKAARRQPDHQSAPSNR